MHRTDFEAEKMKFVKNFLQNCDFIYNKVNKGCSISDLCNFVINLWSCRMFWKEIAEISFSYLKVFIILSNIFMHYFKVKLSET